MPNLQVDPTAALDADDVDEEDDPKPADQASAPAKELHSLRITRKDLERYGFTPACPRCREIRLGNYDTSLSRTALCRAPVYAEMHSAKDPKLVKWLKQHPG